VNISDTTIYRLLTREELPIDTAALARFLIGKVVVRELGKGVVSGRIVETEAYTVGDAAGHAYRGMTPRNRSLFAERGRADVYLVYGTSYMLNVSSELRALQRLEGIPIMQRNRGVERVRDLARGPGRLVDGRLNALDLCRKGPLWLACGGDKPGKIGRSIRIGISRDAKRLLRFYLRGNRFVSAPKSLNTV
jgi:DNA-3-methyladenine glycosylase